MRKHSAVKSNFWISIIEKLNVNGDLYQMVPEVLEDLCLYFGFGCAFVYQANHSGKLFLQDHYAKYVNDHLHVSIDLSAMLDSSLMSELVSRRVISFTAKTDKDNLEEILGNLFNANLLILVPVTDQANKLISLVGFADRRGAVDFDEDDFLLAKAVLSAVSNHVKLQLYQERVKGSKKALESMLDNMGVDIYVNDFLTHEILYVNRSMAEPYGGIEKLMGRKCWEALYEDKTGQCDFCPQRKLIDESGNPTKIYSWDYKRPFDGSWFRVLSAAFKWLDGRLAHVVSSVDITENKRNEEIIRKMAEYDPLTGLPNRRKLVDDCARIMDNLENTCGIYLFFFDLDGFKDINDTLGHNTGDDLLTLVGGILQGHPLIKNKVYRQGGDEFIILCDGKPLKYVLDIIDFLRNSFKNSFSLKDGKVICSASVGIAHYPTDADSTDMLIHNADLAMYQSKRKGRGLVHFYNKGDICLPEEYIKTSQAPE